MSKQDIIKELLEIKKDIKKNMPFGEEEDKYILTQFSYRHVFDDYFDQLLETAKEVLVELKNPDFLQEQERQLAEIASTMTQNDLSQEELMNYFVNELANKSNDLGNVIESVNDEMRRIFVQRVISGLEDYHIRFDEDEIMMILKGETTKRTDKMQERFTDDMRSSISNDLTATANNVEFVRENNLSNKALEKRFDGYEEDLYNEIIFHLQRANHTDRFTFSENYYEMLVDLRHRTRRYEEIYLDALSTGVKPLSKSIENLLEEVMSKKSEMTNSNEELVQSPNAMMFK